MSLFSNLDMSASTVKGSVIPGIKNESKFFSPGNHELKITEVSEPRISTKDESWRYVLVTGTNSEGSKSIRLLVTFPTQTIAHANDEKGRNEYQLRNFLSALGYEATNETLAKDLEAVFSESGLKKLVGQRIKVELGFRGWHSGWDRDAKKNTLVDRQGGVLREGGEPVLFASRDEAEVYAKAKNFYYTPFVDVLKFIASDAARPVTMVKKGFGSK